MEVRSCCSSQTECEAGVQGVLLTALKGNSMSRGTEVSWKSQGRPSSCEEVREWTKGNGDS